MGSQAPRVPSLFPAPHLRPPAPRWAPRCGSSPWRRGPELASEWGAWTPDWSRGPRPAPRRHPPARPHPSAAAAPPEVCAGRRGRAGTTRAGQSRTLYSGVAPRRPSCAQGRPRRPLGPAPQAPSPALTPRSPTRPLRNQRFLNIISLPWSLRASRHGQVLAAPSTTHSQALRQLEATLRGLRRV